MEKNSIWGYILVAIVTIIIGVGIGFGISYFSKDFNEQEITENNDVQLEQNCQDSCISVIPASDLVTLFYEASDEHFQILYAYIDNGFLYYFHDTATADGLNKAPDGVTDTAFDFISTFGANIEGKTDIKKYEGLENITRIKTYNVGTGINPESFLITESGKVYSLLLIDGELKVSLAEEFKDYQVENILSHSEEMNDTFELLLKDGTTKIIN